MDINSYINSTDKRYYLPDTLKEDTEILIFDTFPKKKDIAAGAPVSADETVNGAKILGEDTKLLHALNYGVCYISNRILVITDEESETLLSELEGMRLGPPEKYPLLAEEFAKKMRKIIKHPKIKLVIYKGDMFRRYYNHYLRSEERNMLVALSDRLDEGMSIIPLPQYTQNQIQRITKEYDVFLNSLLSLTDAE